MTFKFTFVSDMTPDYDILNGDVLMADGIKMERPLPNDNEQHVVEPQKQIVQQFVYESTQSAQLQHGKQLARPIQQTLAAPVARKQVARQMVKHPRMANYVQTSNVTMVATPSTVVQPITTMSTTTTNMIDNKPKIKILKKVATGGIANGIATNLTTTTNTLSTVTATAVNTIKDASGTIVINKSNGNFAGNLYFLFRFALLWFHNNLAQNDVLIYIMVIIHIHDRHNLIKWNRI